MNTVKQYIVFIIFLALFTRCKDNSHVEFSTIHNVTCNLTNDSSLIHSPLEMIKVYNYLFISDFKGDSLLWIYNTNSNKMEKKGLPKGLGPHDFLPPVQITSIDSSIVNIHNRWHFNFNLCQFNKENLSLNFIKKRINISTDIDMIYPIKNNYYIASGKFTDGRFAILNSEGKITNYFGEYPDLISEEKGYDNFTKFMFPQSMFTYNKKKNLIASTTSHILEIFNCDSNYCCTKKISLSPYKYQQKIENNWNIIDINKNTQIGAKRIYSTNNYIYILYNPNNLHERENKKNEIWVFDWEGNAIKKLIPDYKILCLCVNESDNIIYCIVNAPNPTIATINLKQS